MNVQILARPDHSLFLYNYLKKVINTQLITFNVAKKNTLLHKIHPQAKLVDEETRILYGFTLYAQVIFRMGRKGLLNPYKWESRYSEVAFKRAAQRFNPDLIHYWPVYCHKFVRQQREKKNVPTLADVYCAHPYHILDIIRPEYDKFNLEIKKSYFYVDAERSIEFLEHESNLITPSEYTKQSFMTYYPDKKIAVAEYGFMADETSFQRYNAAIDQKRQFKNNRLRIVYVGTVSIEKGVHYLIEAIKKMNSKEIELDIIGPVITGQEKIFSPYLSIDGVSFLGFKPNKEIKSILWKYDLMVIPSLSDAYSLAAVEALQNALPVIVTTNNGIEGAVEKFNIGESVPPKDSEAIARAIEKFTDTDYRDHLSSNIRNYIQEDMKYPYPLQVLDIYKALISGGH